MNMRVRSSGEYLPPTYFLYPAGWCFSAGHMACQQSKGGRRNGFFAGFLALGEPAPESREKCVSSTMREKWTNEHEARTKHARTSLDEGAARPTVLGFDTSKISILSILLRCGLRLRTATARISFSLEGTP